MVVFCNHDIALHGDVALVMVSYDFHSRTSDMTTVHFSLAYKRCGVGMYYE